MRWITVMIVAFVQLASFAVAAAEPSRESVNSIGMTLVRIEPGSFEMGVDSNPLPEVLIKGIKNASYDRPDGNGDYDEVPVHRVTITQPLLIGATEVTAEQYRQFKPDYSANEYWAPYATGISWNDATAFCEWLSKTEGRPYRLPTEGEWEFVCRAGTRTPFAAGAAPAAAGVPNQWGVKNMQASVPEWCYDWWARYSAEPQIDPVGPATGTAKIVRGGALDWHKNAKLADGPRFPAEAPYYRRSANRACCAADFASPDGHIGFRVVQADFPKTAPIIPEPLFFSSAIKQTTPDLKAGPDASKPYYHSREMFPNLGNINMRDVGWKLGLPSGLGQAYHNSAIQQCPNGDLVAAYYNTLQWEDDIDQSIVTMRLRYGSDEWDMPEPWPDFTDADDAGPIFFNDRGKLWFFFGSRWLTGGPPFQFLTSNDSGATWTPAITPTFTNKVGGFTPQPVNSIVVDRDGTMYVPVDGVGSTTGLYATSDGGKTWRDTGGRTAGRHTTFVLGKDGSLIGFGGKNSNIDGFMPKSITSDGGKTYVNSKTPFMPLGGGQRPSVIRLQSGRLFFVADTLSSRAPGGRNASFVALSDDEGATWQRRELPIKSTCGYVTSTQAANGVIHIVTSKTKVDGVAVPTHIELNEAWVLQGGDAAPENSTVEKTESEKETYSDGQLKAQWTGGRSSNGNYRLDGQQIFYYASGAKQWESNYVGGKHTGSETFWNPDGKKKWERTFANDGSWTWQMYDSAGQIKATSKWQGKRLIDPPQPATKPGELNAAPAGAQE